MRFRKPLIVSMILLAFIAGWLSAGKQVVSAQDLDARLEVRTVGPESSLIVYYPSLKKAYVYANPFVGAPGSGCAYAFQLGKAGGPITRTPCN
jgi:hypothetical protein